MLSDFEKAVGRTAAEEYNTFHLNSENDEPLSGRIKQYWQDINLHFPGVAVAWSAVFVSWCIKQAGATSDEFKFSPQHSVFVHWAIGNMQANRGLFRAHSISVIAQSIGDIIHNKRHVNTHDFAFAATHNDYPSHSAIVVETGHDHDGLFAVTIGGNESDSVRRKRVALDEDGLIVQRTNSPFICVIQNLK
jgi:hypothetical protein